MPRNRGRGRTKRKRGISEERGECVGARELVLRRDGLEYARVTRILGDELLEAACADGRTRTCRFPGGVQKRAWVAAGDVVLLGLRDFQDYRADVIHRYYADEVRRLEADGHIPKGAFGAEDDDAVVLQFDDHVGNASRM